MIITRHSLSFVINYIHNKIYNFHSLVNYSTTASCAIQSVNCQFDFDSIANADEN